MPPGCRRLLLGLVLALALPGPARAQSELQLMLDPVLGRQIARGEYRLTYYPDERVQGQPAELSLTQHRLSGTTPLWQDSRDEWFVSGSVRLQDFHTRAVLPDTGDRFPGELWTIRFGAIYRHQFDNGWMGGLNVTVGSASDKPFHSEHELTFQALGLLRVPQGERNAWLFSIFYANDVDPLGIGTAIPIPGIAYQWAPSDKFLAIIGIPFTSIEYHPVEKLTLEALYSPVRRVRVRVTCAVFRPLRVYAGFDWDSESHFRADRTDKGDKLFYYEKRWTGGIRFDLQHVGFDVSGGWAFDRFYFEGEGYADRHDNRVDVHDGWFTSARVSLRF